MNTIEHSDKRVLMVTSVASMIGLFNMNNILILQEMKYEVHVACNFRDYSIWDRNRINELVKELKTLNVKCYQVDFSRNISLLKSHIRAFKQLKYILIKENYSFIHCHSPIGGAVGRLAAHTTDTRVIYTAHGFHFYKKAPIMNWLVYYQIEKFLARYTDLLITINTEDYQRAQKFSTGRLEYVPGVGIDLQKFNAYYDMTLSEKRSELGLSHSDFVILSVGELNANKNHGLVIWAISRLKMKNLKYLICGMGVLESKLKELANKLGVSKQVIFLGLRDDIADICRASDLFAFPSKREGLSVALMEAMACGLPIICSKIRGNTDLISEEKGGYLFSTNNRKEFLTKLRLLLTDKEKRQEMSYFNQMKIKKFDIKNVGMRMRNIYIVFDKRG